MTRLQPLTFTPPLLALQVGLAQMLKGGVIMDVTTPEEARIAEEAGAVAVMALERVPADIRKEGGIARMSDPTMIKAIKEAVTIPVMAKARIGHFVEAQILEALGVDYIDESEVRLLRCVQLPWRFRRLPQVIQAMWLLHVTRSIWAHVVSCSHVSAVCKEPEALCPLQVLTPADDLHHINKHNYKVPFVCGCRDLGEALRRLSEGAAMIRTKASHTALAAAPQPSISDVCLVTADSLSRPHLLMPCAPSLAVG